MPSRVVCSAVFSGLPYENKYTVINMSSGQTGERHEKGEYNIIIMIVTYVNYVFYLTVFIPYIFFMPVDKIKI
jgi:hypothetical protein